MGNPHHSGNRNAERQEEERCRDDTESEDKETWPGRDNHHDYTGRPRKGMRKINGPTHSWAPARNDHARVLGTPIHEAPIVRTGPQFIKLFASHDKLPETYTDGILRDGDCEDRSNPYGQLLPGIICVSTREGNWRRLQRSVTCAMHKAMRAPELHVTSIWP